MFQGWTGVGGKVNFFPFLREFSSHLLSGRWWIDSDLGTRCGWVHYWWNGSGRGGEQGGFGSFLAGWWAVFAQLGAAMVAWCFLTLDLSCAVVFNTAMELCLPLPCENITYKRGRESWLLHWLRFLPVLRNHPSPCGCPGKLSPAPLELQCGKLPGARAATLPDLFSEMRERIRQGLTQWRRMKVMTLRTGMCEEPIQSLFTPQHCLGLML